MCFNPKPVIFEEYKKINEETGEIYRTKRPRFLSSQEINANNALADNVEWIPCGQCEDCLASKSSDMATRAILELKNWPNSTFVTLTYSNNKLPKHRSLCKADLQKFWKRLRKRGYKVRYLACGEYGPRTSRPSMPHYHAIIFNYWPKDIKPLHKSIHDDQLYTSKELEEIWGNGYIVIGHVNYETCAYVARYVMKKAYGTANPYQLAKRGKEPEFLLASRRPGLGYYATNDDKLLRNFGVPIKTNQGVFIKPLPHYIREKLREKFREDYFNLSKAHARELKKIARARETDKNYFEYNKLRAKHRSEQLKRLDKRQDFE